MMRLWNDALRKGLFVLMSWLSAAIYTADACAYVVFIDTGTEKGRALLFHYGGICYALTAAHAIERDYHVTVTVPEPDNLYGSGQRVLVAPGDIGLIETQAIPLDRCGMTFDDLSKAVSDFFARPTRPASATLRLAEGSGSVSSIPLFVRMVTPYEWVVFPSMDRDLLPGMSGGMVAADGIPVAMLQTVDAGTGEGRAMRLDVALWLVGRHLKDRPSIPRPPPVMPTATGFIPYDILSVNAPAVSRETGPENMKPGANGMWIAEPKAFPVDLVVGFGSELTDLHKVILLAPADRDERTIPRQIGISVSTSESGDNWVSFGIWTLSQTEGRISINLKKRAKRLMIRIFDTWGGHQIFIKGLYFQ